MAALITINDVEIPAPARGLECIVATNVDSGRNANGEVVGQVVGRDIYKLNNLQWPWLSNKDWSDILKLFDQFFVVARIPDMVNGGFITLKMYPGDRSAEPYWIDTEEGTGPYGLTGSKQVLWWRNCKVNIIDCGIID